MNEKIKYRDFEIKYHSGTRLYSCNQLGFFDSYELADIKEYIDTFITNNKDFEPFYIDLIPSKRYPFKREKIKVIGIRGNVLILKSDTGFYDEGLYMYLSKLNEFDYMIYNEDNEIYFSQLDEINEKRKLLDSQESEIFKKLKIKKVSSFMGNDKDYITLIPQKNSFK